MYICMYILLSVNKAISRCTIMSILHLLCCIFFMIILLLFHHFPMIHGQTHSPTAAIVRRLNPSPRTNPYRSMIPSQHIHNQPQNNQRTLPSTVTRILGSSKGVAKVTPISVQSASFETIRLTSRPASNINNQLSTDRLLQKPSTTLIQVIDSSDSNQTTTISPIAPTTTTSTTTTIASTTANISTASTETTLAIIANQSSHRQAKFLRDATTSTSTTTTTTTTTTTESESEANRINNDNNNSNLCFLSHGGSSETFTVNEAVPVDSVIGTIKVIGDSTDDGNIELSIIDDNNNNNNNNNNDVNNSTDDQSLYPIPIRIEPGTKELILIRKLDKESVEGESSVTIGVRCRPKRQFDKRKLARKLSNDNESYSNRVEKRIATDDSNNLDQSYWSYDSDGSNTEDDIIIPIRILVTDANDNKPEWQGNVPYSVNISEMTSVGSVVMTGIRAIDNDQLGPYSTVEYHVEPGPYSHLLRFASPLEGTLILAGQLDYETLPYFWISIRAQDQGNPPNTAVTKVNVTVIDADDQNPRFECLKYTAILSEGQMTGIPLEVQPKPIKAEDPDRGIQSPIVYELNSKDEDSRENSYFKIDAQNGQVSLKRPLHSSVSLPLVIVIRVTQLNNRDRYALTTLTIVSKRDQIMPELRFLHSNYSTSLLENTPPGQVALTVQSSRPSSSSGQPLRFQILDDEEGYFTIKNTAEIIVSKMLDYEKHHRYSFRVMVTDGRQTDLARVTIDIINVNEHDPIFSQSSYVFHVNEARLKSSPIIGQMQASDADDGDRVQLSLSGPHAAAFALSSDGILRIRSLRLVNTTECHMIAIATDSGSPPRSSSASVVVKFAPALLKSISGRTLESLFLFELEQQNQHDSPSDISPTAVDILQHSAANIFSASTNSTALVLVIVLGVLLGTLFIIIVALTLHVLKNRKYESRRSSNCSPVTLHQHHQTSSSSASSSSSSSSDFSLSGLHPHHPHPHHHLHAHNSHLQHWPSKDESPKRSIFQASVISMQRSAKVTPYVEPTRTSPDTNESDDYCDNNKQMKLLENDNQIKQTSNMSPTIAAATTTTTAAATTIATISNNNSSTEQNDSAISSDHSCCWSQELHNNMSTNNNNNKFNHSSQTTATTNSDSSTSDMSNGNLNCENSTTNSTVASRISVIRWPQGSIPRRVKKLTWKDEQRNNHLDQLYTSNSIVQAPSIKQQQMVMATKTKTLGGHLLTGSTSTSSTSSSSMINVHHGHYHLHHNNTQPSNNSSNNNLNCNLNNSITTIRHHQTPHYPVITNNNNNNNNNNHHNNSPLTNSAAATTSPTTTTMITQPPPPPPLSHYKHSMNNHDPSSSSSTTAVLPDLTVYF